MLKTFLLSLILTTVSIAQAQLDQDEVGAWYMLFWSTDFSENSRFGAQGDIQWRNWDLGGDLEQLLLRGGLTYSPKNAKVKLTLGYGNITTGVFGDSDETSGESRIYQEALMPHKLSERIRLTHRFRYEQRWVEGQDLRTRYRYNLFMNIGLNGTSFDKGQWYLALYNELFINGQRLIKEDSQNGDRRVELFDRNRSYAAIGYTLNSRTKVQGGWMKQTTDNWAKGQIQLSLHKNF